MSLKKWIRSVDSKIDVNSFNIFLGILMLAIGLLPLFFDPLNYFTEQMRIAGSYGVSEIPIVFCLIIGWIFFVSGLYYKINWLKLEERKPFVYRLFVWKRIGGKKSFIAVLTLSFIVFVFTSFLIIRPDKKAIEFQKSLEELQFKQDELKARWEEINKYLDDNKQNK